MQSYIHNVIFTEMGVIVVMLQTRIWEVHGSNPAFHYVLSISAVSEITTAFIKL
jgi:hypothetical protein